MARHGRTLQSLGVYRRLCNATGWWVRAAEIDIRKLTLAEGAQAFVDLNRGRCAAAEVVFRP